MAKLILFRSLTTTRNLWKRAPLESGGDGFRTVSDGSEVIKYEVTYDPSAIEDLARKAAGNKSQRSHAGPLFVRVIERKKL